MQVMEITKRSDTGVPNIKQHDRNVPIIDEDAVLNVESKTRMGQIVEVFNFKRKHIGITNVDLEVQRINQRVNDMLVAHQKNLKVTDNKLQLVRKFFNLWRGERTDNLACLKKTLEEDLTKICCVEIVGAYQHCFQTKQIFNVIHIKQQV